MKARGIRQLQLALRGALGARNRLPEVNELSLVPSFGTSRRRFAPARGGLVATETTRLSRAIGTLPFVSSRICRAVGNTPDPLWQHTPVSGSSTWRCNWRSPRFSPG